MNFQPTQSGGMNLRGVASYLNRALDEYLARPAEPSAAALLTGPVRTGAHRAPMVASRPARGLGADHRKPQAVSTTVLDDLIEDAQALQGLAWTDAQLARIPSEDLAKLAFQISQPLRREFPTEAGFLAYWRAQHKQSGLTGEASTDGLDTPSAERNEQDPAFVKEWATSPALRAEFREDFPAYAAYRRATQRGASRIMGKPPAS